VSEHHELIECFEQNPGLLSETEEAIDWTSVGGKTQQRSDPNTQTEEGLSALDWPEPEPLGGELPAVRAFDLALLPDSLRPLVEDTAERMQVPPLRAPRHGCGRLPSPPSDGAATGTKCSGWRKNER
jgi:hypothetical protein